LKKKWLLLNIEYALTKKISKAKPACHFLISAAGCLRKILFRGNSNLLAIEFQRAFIKVNKISIKGAFSEIKEDK